MVIFLSHDACILAEVPSAPDGLSFRVPSPSASVVFIGFCREMQAPLAAFSFGFVLQRERHQSHNDVHFFENIGLTLCMAAQIFCIVSVVRLLSGEFVQTSLSRITRNSDRKHRLSVYISGSDANGIMISDTQVRCLGNQNLDAVHF